MFSLVRHAAYSLSTGSLDAQGVLDSQALASKLAKFGPWERILTSPALRTKETAEIIAQSLSLPVEIDPDLGLDGDFGTQSPLLAPEGKILVSHAPILHTLIKRWTKTFSLPLPEPLGVGEGYVIDPSAGTIIHLNR